MANKSKATGDGDRKVFFALDRKKFPGTMNSEAKISKLF